jgi:uncharacterized membrane protein
VFDLPLKNSWLFPAIESLHVVGLALFVGAISLVNFTVLGIVRAGVAQRGERWVYWGLGLVIVTGPVMFFADANRYLHNSAFLVKMGLFAAAVAFQWWLRTRPVNRLTAAGSLMLWSMVVLGGRAIADFDV